MSEKTLPATHWTDEDKLTDDDLLRGIFDVADSIARLAHQLDALALRIDQLAGAAGRRWVPESYDRIEAEEQEATAAQGCNGVK